ncbi:TSUP family transporter [Candidatus Gottesmanbacteria bacterium]|nr:TSUP family transporter [Candidatus Gottesmanbacteria bacterium]
MLLLVFLIGLAAGFVDSTVGSGGLISIPGLIFLGLPPQVAIATDRLGSAGQTAAALLTFWKAKKIRWNYVIPFTFLAIIGSYLGARLLITIDPKMLEKIIGLMLVVVLPFLFLKKSLGTTRKKTNIVQKIIGFVNYFFIMIYNGFFGTGSGPFAIFNTMYFFGFTVIESNATGIIPWFALSILSLVVFAQSGIIDWQKGIIFLAGMAAGGWLGARVAVTKGDVWVKRLFVVVVILSGIKLLVA